MKAMLFALRLNELLCLAFVRMLFLDVLSDFLHIKIMHTSNLTDFLCYETLSGQYKKSFSSRL